METMKHTGAEMSYLASSERFTVAITRQGLFRIEVHPRRRWKWWGKRGWLVVLHLLHEQGDTWSCRKFITSFQDLCTRLGIDQDDPVWQERTPQPLLTLELLGAQKTLVGCPSACSDNGKTLHHCLKQQGREVQTEAICNRTIQHLLRCIIDMGRSEAREHARPLKQQKVPGEIECS